MTNLYFIKSNTDNSRGKSLYKIGITKDIKRRIDAINVSTPNEIELVYKKPFSDGRPDEIHSAKWYEKKLHEYFNTRRVKGEWFLFDSIKSKAKKEFISVVNEFESPIWRLKECESTEDFYHMSSCKDPEWEDSEDCYAISDWNNNNYRCPICGAPPAANDSKNYAYGYIKSCDSWEYEEWRAYGEHKDFKGGDEHLEWYFNEKFEEIMWYYGWLIKRKMIDTIKNVA